MSHKPILDILPIYNENLYVDAENSPEYHIEAGQFEKKIMAVCLKEDFNEASLTLAVKMLNSCKLELKDFYIITIKHESDLIACLGSLHPETALLFGIKLSSPIFQVNKSLYKPFRFNNIKFVLSDNINTIISNQSLKRSLWEDGLKIVFNIS